MKCVAVVKLCLTAEQAIQRAESLRERFNMFGGAEPAGDHITEESVIFTHRLQEEENTACCYGHVVSPKNT